MYGGYGNIWSQGSGQWPGVNVTNQLPVQNQHQQQQQTAPAQPYQAQQQNMMGYGANLTNLGNQAAAGGMMGYMNMGMGTANPFMNFGGNSTGFGLQQPTNTTTATPWLGNQQFQLHQAFPGGRPPLPPGPPPPDTPKEKSQPAQFCIQSQQPPLPQSSNLLGANIANQQRAPPPPPPPPPPEAKSTQSLAPVITSAGGSLSGSTVPGSTMNLEDAYNIIKNAAAYGMLPSCGPLAPLTTLNVSEELFGSKKSNEGIPGLDFSEEDKPSTPVGPEVVDLDNEAESTKSNETPALSNAGTFTSTAKEETPENGLQPNSQQITENNSPGLSRSEKNELVWELRPDVKTQEWKRADQHANGSGTRTDNNGWKTKQQDTTLDSRRSSDNKPAVNNVGKLKDEEITSQKNSNIVQSSEDGESRVTIPLESADGKALVYDRKTLKQFDHKFREWENQFEDWKRSNQNHPNQVSYKQYLDQWNSWREQLIEQRRSIIDKMTKAKLDCKEILLAKFESMDVENLGSQSQGVSLPSESSAGNPRHPREPIMPEDGQDFKSKETENPFQAALRGTDGGRRPPLPSAPQISSVQENNEKSTGIPPLMPNLIDKKPLLQASSSNNERTSRDRPVEKILRISRNDRNIFDVDDDFSRDRQEKNPFEMNTSSVFEGKSSFSEPSKENKKKETDFESGSSVRIPFDWSLPSQRKDNNNPFDISSSSDNPFMQPSGPNPFEIKPEQKLPSLDDFIRRTNLNFSTSSGSAKQNECANPFAMPSTISPGMRNVVHTESQFERIPRDPQGSNKSSSTSTNSLRLEANPVGMPLLIAAKESSPVSRNNERDEISHLFSRDRGPVIEGEIDCSNYGMDEDFAVEDAEVIDYGAGANSMDSMDFPRGENPDDNNNDDDPDFSLEDSDVIDYSQSMPLRESGAESYSEVEPYGGYSEEFDQGYPQPPYYGSGPRGRGRGHPVWGRGHTRGPPPGHPYERGGQASQYAPEFTAPRGRGFNRGIGRGHRGPPPSHEWFQHDERETQHPHPPLTGFPDPEVVELSPSPEPVALPGIKIAPPNPEFDRAERRRSRSRDRGSRDRSRSRSRERVNRRGREDTDRRGDDRRERDRDRRSSPDRRGRYDSDERDQRRDRDRDRDRFRDRGRRRSRSRSPTEDRSTVVRNPLFPSASAGVLGAHPASNPPPPRYQTVLIEDILNTPGRTKRPSRLVIFMRGLPGSGKSHLVKLIKEREVEMGGKAPRILSLDNYFITEMEKMEKDPITGVEVKKTVMEYEYDEEREPLYRAQLVRQFKKTLDEGYFSFVIVDCVNEYVRQFEEMANVATQKRFQVYVIEIEESAEVCVKRNTHKRTRDDIMKINRNWERTPSQFVKLDARTLLQDEAIQEVEMEDVSDVEADSIEKEKAPTPAERGKIGPQVVDLEEIEDEDSGDHILQSSKWDSLEPSQEKLNKLDGLMRRRRANSEEAQVESAPSIETWLSGNMPEDYAYRKPTQAGQKRVRWADIEERREQERMREVGFVVGQTDWKRMMDPTCGSSALTRTKFF